MVPVADYLDDLRDAHFYGETNTLETHGIPTKLKIYLMDRGPYETAIRSEISTAVLHKITSEWLRRPQRLLDLRSNTKPA